MMPNPSASLSDFVARANATLVRYPRFNELHADIRLCQELSKMAGEPQCMALEGRPGIGKSTLVKTYTQVLARYQTIHGTKIPVFYMETPSPVTVKGMAARMLETLGDPAAHKGTLWSMNSRLIHFINACEVQLVILDDFHHLIDKETNRILETVSDWLKVLIKETNIPFLVVGVEGKVEQILRANEQLSRLFAVRERLEPFPWDPSDAATIQAFSTFMRYVETGVGLSLSDELPRQDLLSRLHYTTEGVVGHVMNLIRCAALLAHQEKAETLKLSLLSKAFTKRLYQHMPQKVDPFILTDKEKFVPLPTPASDELNSTNNRSNRRSKKGPTASEVLTTT